MRCQDVRRQLGAYLDGELGDHQASALRGHLRTCEACRADADAESKLVESLRELPAIDPPAAMWQAIRGQLAQQEIADAQASWHVRLWRRITPWAPHAGAGALATVAAVTLLWWTRAPAPPGSPRAGEPGVIAPTAPAPGSQAPAVAVVDVSAALAEEVALADQSYGKAVAELAEMIAEDRASWVPAYAQRYDEQVQALQARVNAQAAGADKERAWQELMRFQQTALTRAELAMEAP